MSTLVAKCPSCGGPVEFKSGQSIVVICQYCRSAVARTDRDLKDLGKVAEVRSRVPAIRHRRPVGEPVVR